MKKMTALFLTLVMVFASLVGCSTESAASDNDAASVDDSEAEASDVDVQEEDSSVDKILMYASGPEEMLKKLEAGFEEERGDVLDMVIMSCGQVRSKTWSEQEAGDIQADIIWGSDPLIYNKLDDKGLLEKVSIDNDIFKGEYLLDDKSYILVNERYITLMYSKKEFEDKALPVSYGDLANEEYSGMLVMADACQSSTALGIASAMYQDMGIEFFESLKGNEAFLCKSNGLVPSTIMEGQYSLGIAPHDAVVRLKNKAKKDGYELPVEVMWPKEGVFAIQRPLALVKDDSRSEEQAAVAEEFMKYMVSKKAQTMTDKFGFVSVRKDMENRFLPENTEVIKIDWDRASKEEDNLVSEYKEIFER